MSFAPSLFENDQEINIFKLFGITISMFSIVFVSLSMYAIIWFEKCGMNQNQTLINNFFASACWAGIAFNTFIQIPEVIIAFGYPLGTVFCTSALILKNVCMMHFASIACSISVVRYLYIFVYRNSNGRFDEFWCSFINKLILQLAFLSQFVFQFWPGKNPYYYYVCLGKNPEQGLKPKLNFLLQTNLVICFFLYLCCVFKIKHFDYKFLKSKALSSSSTKKSKLSEFITSALTLVTMLVVMTVAIILNGTSGQKLMTYPYYYLVQFHLHGCPFLLAFLLTLSHFLGNNKLREVIHREFKQNTVGISLINV